MRHWFFVVVAVFVLVGVAGCAHTEIARGPDDCGQFASSDTGVGLIHVPAGQYERYARACGAERFSRVVAEHRSALVRAAQAAAAGGRDDDAREGVTALRHDLRVLTERVAGTPTKPAESDSTAEEDAR